MGGNEQMLVRRKSISAEAYMGYVSGASDTQKERRQREILYDRESSILMGGGSFSSSSTGY